jgi:hypothetical protein
MRIYQFEIHGDTSLISLCTYSAKIKARSEAVKPGESLKRD